MGFFEEGVEAATAAINRRDWATALDIWRSMIERLPEDPIGFNGTGDALIELGKLDEAEAVYAEAMSRFPANVWGAAGYAKIAARRGDRPEALSRWQRVCREFPDEPVGYTGLADALRETGRLEEADAVLAAAVEKLPDAFWPMFGYVRLAADGGDWDEASRRATALVQRFPDQPASHLQMALAVGALGRLEEADAVLSRAVARMPEDFSIACRYAEMAMKRRAWADAVTRWESVRRTFPGEILGYRQNIDALLALGRPADALAGAQEALARFPDDTELALLRTRLELREKSTPDMLEGWSVFFSRFPESKSPLLLPDDVNKTGAIYVLGKKLGLVHDGDVISWQEVSRRIGEIREAIGPLDDQGLSFVRHDELPEVEETTVYPGTSSQVRGRYHSSIVVPDYLEDWDEEEEGDTPWSGDVRILRVTDGYICHFADGPLVLGPDGCTVIEDYSSGYARLFPFYRRRVADCVSNARYIDGVVIPIADDVRGLNYYHWMIDWLPRLAFLGPRCRHPDVFVVTTPITTEFQRKSLQLCGFDDDRIIGLDNFTAVRARELLVPNNFPRTDPAPDALWIINYLRATLGFGALLEAALDVAGTRPRARKIYISRADAPSRRIQNEPDLVAHLTASGYQSVALSELPLVEQIALFASASHVVGMHGAGLTNIAFAPPGARLIEILSRRYLAGCYFGLAESVGAEYLGFVADQVIPGPAPHLDDLIVDIDEFAAKCAHFYAD